MQRSNRSLALAALAALALAAPATLAAASEPVVDPAAGTMPGIDPATESAEGTARSPAAKITPLVAPLPFKNTQIGWGLALMAGAIHRFDADTTIKPSTGMAGGFYTENGSWGLMAMENARLARDAWRVRGVVNHVDVRYDFFGIGEEAGEAGRSIGVRQKIDMLFASGLGRIRPALYAGPSVLWMRSAVELRDTLGLAIRPDGEDVPATNLFSPGLQAEYDTRDDDYWPTVGSIAKLKAYFFTSALGGSRDFQRYVASWSWYARVPGDRSVIATNLNAALAGGDVPFYGLPSIGAGKYGLRGYTQGRYRDHVMTTAQAEWRRPLAGRFGATVFGGFGQVAPSVGHLADEQVLWAGGAGARFRLTRQYPMNLRLDFAWGRDEPLFYFSLTEAF